MHILYLEDYEPDVKLMSRYMRSMNHNFISVATIEEAWEYLNTHAVDVFLVDVLIGRDTAYELIDAVAREGLVRSIVAVTAKALPNEQQYCLDLGCAAVVPKPFTIDDIDLVLGEMV